MFVELHDFPSYAVTDDGKIVSLKFGRWRERKPSLSWCGYHVLILMKDGKQVGKSVHRLIAGVFLGPSDLQVNHKNGIKTDNRIENLEYVTNLENSHHARDLGLRDHLKGPRGYMKINAEQENAIKAVAYKTDVHEVARQFGIKKSLVYQIWSKTKTELPIGTKVCVQEETNIVSQRYTRALPAQGLSALPQGIEEEVQTSLGSQRR